MDANNSLNDPINSQEVDVIIDHFIDRLGTAFEAETNHDSRSVTVNQIPEEHKAELAQLLGDQGYQVSFNV